MGMVGQSEHSMGCGSNAGAGGLAGAMCPTCGSPMSGPGGTCPGCGMAYSSGDMMGEDAGAAPGGPVMALPDADMAQEPSEPTSTPPDSQEGEPADPAQKKKKPFGQVGFTRR